MKRLFVCLGLLATTLAIAKEPANLSIIKQRLIKYHDSGAYMADIANVNQKAMRYLELRVKQKNFTGKPVVILDIDDTSLSNYPYLFKMGFGGTAKEFRDHMDKGADDAIASTLKLYRFAKEHNIAVIFITGRFEEERAMTEENLKKAGFTNYDELIMRNDQYRKSPAAIYKTAYRKQLTDQGYDIILNIGDQKSDLRGGYSDESFKLPNPYYYIP